MTVYARMIAACGLSIEEAAAVCGISASSSKKRYYGVSKVRPRDLARLSAVYAMICDGMVGHLPVSAREAAVARQILEGTRKLPATLEAQKTAVDEAYPTT